MGERTKAEASAHYNALIVRLRSLLEAEMPPTADGQLDVGWTLVVMVPGQGGDHRGVLTNAGEVGAREMLTETIVRLLDGAEFSEISNGN
jgi:hypothetical protein